MFDVPVWKPLSPRPSICSDECKYMRQHKDDIVHDDANADADNGEQGHQEPEKGIRCAKHEVVDSKVDGLLRGASRGTE